MVKKCTKYYNSVNVIRVMSRSVHKVKTILNLRNAKEDYDNDNARDQEKC